MIAAFSLFGLDPLDGVRATSTLFFVANAALVAFIIYRATSSKVAALLASYLALSAFPMVHIHLQALSEPMFIFLSFSGFCFLVVYLSGGQPRMLYWAALTIALGSLTEIRWDCHYSHGYRRDSLVRQAILAEKVDRCSPVFGPQFFTFVCLGFKKLLRRGKSRQSNIRVPSTWTDGPSAGDRYDLSVAITGWLGRFHAVGESSHCGSSISFTRLDVYQNRFSEITPCPGRGIERPNLLWIFADLLDGH